MTTITEAERAAILNALHDTDRYDEAYALCQGDLARSVLRDAHTSRKCHFCGARFITTVALSYHLEGHLGSGR